MFILLLLESMSRHPFAVNGSALLLIKTGYYRRMKVRDVVDLVILSALWGASFLFMRFAVPEFGPVALA